MCICYSHIIKKSWRLNSKPIRWGLIRTTGKADIQVPTKQLYKFRVKES
jgi:hypothetical protein